MDIDYEVKGLKELNRELKKLPNDFRQKGQQAAVAAAARTIRDEAKIIVPRNTGLLQSAIAVRKVRTDSQWIKKSKVTIKPMGKIQIKVRGKVRTVNRTYYGFILENGSPKYPAQPFMRVAFERKKKAAVVVFGNVLNRKIKLANKKLGRIV